jgi:hypothetical protein
MSPRSAYRSVYPCASTLISDIGVEFTRLAARYTKINVYSRVENGVQESKAENCSN